jgi:hypothetical protein
MSQAQLTGLALCAYLMGKLLMFWLWIRFVSLRVKAVLVLGTGFGWFTFAHWFTDFSQRTWYYDDFSVNHLSLDD